MAQYVAAPATILNPTFAAAAPVTSVPLGLTAAPTPMETLLAVRMERTVLALAVQSLLFSLPLQLHQSLQVPLAHQPALPEPLRQLAAPALL